MPSRFESALKIYDWVRTVGSAGFAGRKVGEHGSDPCILGRTVRYALGSNARTARLMAMLILVISWHLLLQCYLRI